MLTAKTIKGWYLVHKWTSLICTVFMLLLCLTGLPLIFHEELEELLGRHPELAELPADTPLAKLDRLVEVALANRPGEVMQYLSFDDHAPLVYITTAPRPDSPSEDAHLLTLDARTADILQAPQFDEGILWVIFKLHTDLYADLPGMLLLGAMGLLFVVAIISGVVVYGPFMRKLDFGTVRTGRSKRIRWLDLHNLLGVVTLAWALVVGFTGTINTLARPILGLWQMDQLAEMTRPYHGLPPATRFGSVDAAVDTANAAAPAMEPSIVAWPGTIFTSAHHYGVFMRGETPLTARLLKPALIDAETGALTDIRDMPWYVTSLFVSQPLHFGDYGGMPLKIIWAVLDVITIVVLISGLYLWLGRRRSPIEERLDELTRGGVLAASALPEPRR